MSIRTDRIHPSWVAVLRPHFDTIESIGARLEADGAEHLPAHDLVFRAFEQPLESVRVVIVGQDPYPTPGHAVGLSFSVNRDVRPIPRSLMNIYRELQDDLGIEPAEHGDLSAWANSGVMLLNRVLTVQAGNAGSDRGIGWKPSPRVRSALWSNGADRWWRFCGAKTLNRLHRCSVKCP